MRSRHFVKDVKKNARPQISSRRFGVYNIFYDYTGPTVKEWYAYESSVVYRAGGHVSKGHISLTTIVVSCEDYPISKYLEVELNKSGQTFLRGHHQQQRRPSPERLAAISVGISHPWEKSSKNFTTIFLAHSVSSSRRSWLLAGYSAG
ncbi:hypothetical protein RRG08_029882 [Elysia crispata]|uniref:Uncharacterized protein n=1 Tax=Elysia crispata TaxID=231223 RepID=A0AAE0YJW7_9GAST|nr:hypothetical protein RRG08_029882 [Elysia crispata]